MKNKEGVDDAQSSSTPRITHQKPTSLKLVISKATGIAPKKKAKVARRLSKKEYAELNVRERARIDAGYQTLDEVSRRLGLGERYLRRIEKHGGAPYHTAERLSRFYNCSMNIWL